MPNGVGLGAIRLPPSLIDGEPPLGFDRPNGGFSALDIDLSGDSEPIDLHRSTTIEMPDGGVLVRIGPPKRSKEDTSFDDNLAESLNEATLGAIASDLIELIDEDNTSRREWLDTRAEGIKILGLKIEAMRANGADGSAPLEGQSQARATLLCESVVRFGANAFSELMPADGPAKVAEDTSGTAPELDQLADALEKDLNHYLMTVDKPYVPDTDAMLPRVGVDGSVFRKVYHDPILRRPVVRTVYGEDLIMNNGATSIYDARRITHRIFMAKSGIRRMQLVGAWRDCDLSDAGWPQKGPIEMQGEEIAGVRRLDAFDRDDREHEFYETYCELDIPEFEHETAGEPDGLAVPYKVVIHRESRQILEIRRNWRQDDEMCLPKTWFVQYCFIRGFGVYGIGLSHLLGNLTNGITAAYREFIDAGMFSNFPGLLVAKGAGRQNNNIFRVAPGGAAEIETAGMPIQDVAMGMPYKGPDAVFVQFISQLNQEGQRLGGTAEVMVGEGRQDAPVGTTLALIEQAIKPILATHKRLCAAQADELQLLVERFREDPMAFVRASRMSKPLKTQGKAYPSGLNWDEQMFLRAINENLIVPRADPNTASHLQRMLRNAALYQMAKDEPGAFNTLRIRQVCIRGIGFSDPDQFINPNPAPPPPDPKAIAAQMSAQADILDSQTKAQQLQHEIQTAPMENQTRQIDAQAKIASAKLGVQKEALSAHAQGLQAQQIGAKVQTEQAKAQNVAREGDKNRAVDLIKQQRDHAHDVQMAGIEGQQDAFQHRMDQQHEAVQALRQQAHEMQTNQMGQAHEAGMARMGQAHEAGLAQQTQAHEAGMASQDRAQELQQTRMGQQHEVGMQRREGRQALAQQAAAPRPTQRAAGGKIPAGDFMSPYGVARLAPDGHHYIKHPDNGRYYRLTRRR